MNRRLSLGPFFAFSAISLGGLTLLILAQGYMSAIALDRWVEVLMTWVEGDFAVVNLALNYPQLPYYLLLPFHLVPLVDGPGAVFLCNCVAGALFLTFWGRWLMATGFSAVAAFLLVTAIVVHPYFLWATTNGGGEIFGFCAFALLVREVTGRDDLVGARKQISLALILAVYCISARHYLLVVLSLLPLLIFLAPARIVRTAVFSYYMVVLFPSIAVAAAYLYLNWIFQRDAFAFLREIEQAIRAGETPLLDSPWLLLHGGSFFLPLLIGLAGSAVTAPTVVLGLARLHRQPLDFPPAIVAAALPPLALAAGTLLSIVSHPIELLGLAVPLAMILVGREREMVGRRPLLPTLALLLAGAAAAWISLWWWPTPDLTRWRQAVLGQPIEMPMRPLVGLGLWLAQRDDVMIDERTASGAIVARGSAAGLVTTETDLFKVAATANQLVAHYVVVPDPATQVGALDRVNAAFPNLYSEGARGYRLVFDRGRWRVYQRRSHRFPLDDLR